MVAVAVVTYPPLVRLVICNYHKTLLLLQAIWLEVNWSMTDLIYSISRWLIVVVFDIHGIDFVSLLNRMIAFMLHSEYTTSFMAKHVVWHNVTSRQGRHFIVLFKTVILFNRLNVNMFFLFICLSDCKYLLFRYVSDTLAGDFFPHSWSIDSRVAPPTLRFLRKRIKIIFCGHCRPWKLKSTKNNAHVFKTKPWKFGDAKITHYTVFRKFRVLHKNIFLLENLMYRKDLSSCTNFLRVPILAQKGMLPVNFFTRAKSNITFSSQNYICYCAHYWSVFVTALECLYKKNAKPCINNMWTALLIHGIVPVKTRLLIACDSAFYAIVTFKQLE